MIAEVTPTNPAPYLWRLLIDRRHQKRGIGRRALDILCDQLRAEGCSTLVTSWKEGAGGPRGFYRCYGFVETGDQLDGETVGRLALSGPGEG